MRSYMARGMRRVPTYYQDLVDIIKANPGHVIGSTACLGGALPVQILKGTDESKLHRWIEQMIGIFGKENFFLEMQPSNNKEQIIVNKKLLEFAQYHELDYIITTDSHYLKKEDRLVHKAYLNAQNGDREVDEFYATTYMMSAEELHEYMDKYNGADVVNQLMENTKLIGERIEQYDLRKPFKLPYLPSRQDARISVLPITVNRSLPDIWYNFINSREAADRVFIRRIIDKCETNPSYYWTPERIDRMTIELETVWNASEKQNLKWSKYFLQVADYIKIAWEEGDTLVGPGRGSGVGF